MFVCLRVLFFNFMPFIPTINQLRKLKNQKLQALGVVVTRGILPKPRPRPQHRAANHLILSRQELVDKHPSLVESVGFIQPKMKSYAVARTFVPKKSKLRNEVLEYYISDQVCWINIRILTISTCSHLLLSRNSWTLSMLPYQSPNHQFISKNQSRQRNVLSTNLVGKAQKCNNQTKKSESKSKKTRPSKPRSKKPSKSKDQNQPSKISHSIMG